MVSDSRSMMVDWHVGQCSVGFCYLQNFPHEKHAEDSCRSINILFFQKGRHHVRVFVPPLGKAPL